MIVDRTTITITIPAITPPDRPLTEQQKGRKRYVNSHPRHIPDDDSTVGIPVDNPVLVVPDTSST